MDPVRYLTTKDSTLKVAMLAICQRAGELDLELGERRATQIANAVARSFKA
jgi:hypothetical protein